MESVNYPLAFVGDLLSPGHLVLILVIALLLFGKRVPEVAHSLGKSFNEFRKGLHEGETELKAMTLDQRDPQDPLLPPVPSSSQSRSGPEAESSHGNNATKPA